METDQSPEYGPWRWALDHPEIGPILRRHNATVQSGGTFDPSQLEAELMSTTWWRTTAAPARAWAKTTALDPAEAQRTLERSYEQVWDIAHRLTDDWGAEALAFFEATAKNAVRLGWDEQQIVSELMRYVPRAGLQTGMLRQTADQLREMASQYATAVGDDWLFEQAKSVARGERTVQDAAAYFKDQALARFPSLRAAIEAGYTVRQYVEPYVQDTVRTLGVNPGEIDLSDPKWSRMLDGAVGQNGERLAFSRDEWVAEIRTNSMYGWDRTQQARDEAIALRQGMRQRLGLEG